MTMRERRHRYYAGHRILTIRCPKELADTMNALPPEARTRILAQAVRDWTLHRGRV